MLTVMGGEIARTSRIGRRAAPPQPPLVGDVDPSSAAGGRPELLNRSPLTPLAAAPLNPHVREGSPLPGILRRSVTIDSPFGVVVKTGRLEVYEPLAARGVGQERKWPCVLLAPAGSNLLAGQELGDGDHAEALPWARAGYVVVQYSLPGAIADPERVTAPDAKRAFAEFSAARAGLGCVEQALAFVKTELPQIDPRRIAAVGHSSAGTLALLAAESNPEIKACVAFAPCTDVTEFHRDNFAILEPVIPTVRKFCSDYSPINHVDRLQCPLFLFQAEDDSVTPLAGAIRFVEAAEGKKNLIEFVRVPTGNHYDSMVGEGIPAAIRWLDATFARATAPRPSAGE
jgi:dienelactone hydrolase